MEHEMPVGDWGIGWSPMRTLQDVAGYRNFDDYIRAKSADMIEAGCRFMLFTFLVILRHGHAR